MEVDVEVAVEIKQHGRYSVLVVERDSKLKRRKQPMLSTAQLFERTAHRQLRNRVRTAVQPRTLNAIVSSEISRMITDALNAQLKAERDEVLGRQPYERLADSPKRNRFKLVSLPGLWGRLVLRRPVIGKGVLRLPLLSALKEAGQNFCDLIATRFWLRGASTRAVAEELRQATGAKLSHSTVSTLTNALEPTLRSWETRPVPPPHPLPVPRRVVPAGSPSGVHP
ncbi:MAG: transposase [Sphingomonas sp.]|nr:transposase [Sphingomonas sp.]